MNLAIFNHFRDPADNAGDDIVTNDPSMLILHILAILCSDSASVEEAELIILSTWMHCSTKVFDLPTDHIDFSYFLFATIHYTL